MQLHHAYRSVTVLFCGPHDEGDRIPLRRIDNAIATALQLNSPLLIAGDGNHGLDVDCFLQRAQAAGVRYIRAFYEPRASTIWDAQAVVNELLNNPPFFKVAEVHLVTDDWHMERARAILEGALREQFSHSVPLIHSVPICTGPRPPEEVLLGERQGLEDYLAGRYGHRRAHPHYGKPAFSSATA